MTKREAILWIREQIAREMRERLFEIPDHADHAPDPALVRSLWADEVRAVADRVLAQRPNRAEESKP